MLTIASDSLVFANGKASSPWCLRFDPMIPFDVTRFLNDICQGRVVAPVLIIAPVTRFSKHIRTVG